MTMLGLFIAQIAIYAAFPIYLASLKNPVRAASFYVYIGIILVLGGFLGAVYSLPLAESLNISGGSLAYGALLMTTVLLVIIEHNVHAVRHVIHLVIIVNVFKFFLFSFLTIVLSNEAVVNPFGTSAAIFSQSLFIVILGGSLIILELLILLYLFEQINKRVMDMDVVRLSSLYTLGFVLVLCLDGLLFPIIAFPFNPRLGAFVVGGVTSKLVLGLAYSVPMMLFLRVYRHNVTEFAEQPLTLKELLRAPQERLVEEIQRQRDSLALSEEQLRAYTQRLSLATESAGLGIWDLDLATDDLEWDKQSYEIYGVEKGDKLETFTDWVDRIHPDDRAAFLEEFHNAVAGRANFQSQFRALWPNGETRYLEVHALVQRGPDDAPQRMIGINRDVTQHKQMAMENEQLAVQFYQVQRIESIGRLAGGIAHDFNNLLVPISGFSELGMAKTMDESLSHLYFRRIKEAADRAAGLTRQILAFSRQQVMEMKVSDLNGIVLQFQSMIQRLIGEQINLKLNLAADPGKILADQGQIEQVLLNLVVNARDAMPNGGDLTITTEKVELDEDYITTLGESSPGLYTMLAVSDTGIGMDEATKQRIFDPFFTTKPLGEGTGLGLPTVFGIVKQHQGNISVYSEVGQGTVFKVYLPVTDAQGQENEDLPRDAGDLYGTETILVVDDDARVRQIVSEVLAAHGYQVLMGKDASVGEEIAEGHSGSIDLLLTDVIMPGSNGRELYEKLLSKYPQLKVLYMSGYTDDRIVLHGMNNGDAPFLNKPFAINVLLRRVKEVLE